LGPAAGFALLRAFAAAFVRLGFSLATDLALLCAWTRALAFALLFFFIFRLPVALFHTFPEFNFANSISLVPAIAIFCISLMVSWMFETVNNS
jgi:hypothetical protein